MIKKIWFWLECSRVFSLPMTIFSWLVAFMFAFVHGGYAVYGLWALVGIAAAQLATNLFDDYMDYRTLSAKGTLKNTVKSKCRYITNGNVTPKAVLAVVGIYCAIALSIGIMLTNHTGYPTAILAIIGGILVLTYSKISSVGLSEIAVFLAFGPILFSGVNWVMLQNYEPINFILSIAVAMFTVGLLYTHNLLDFDADMASDKKTLCCRMKNNSRAVDILLVIYAFGYITIAFGVIFNFLTPIYFITYFTLPLTLELFYSLKLYTEDKKSIPEKHWWHIMENMNKIRKDGVESFMFRLYQARNLMIYFSILVCISIILTRFLLYK